MVVYLLPKWLKMIHAITILLDQNKKQVEKGISAQIFTKKLVIKQNPGRIWHWKGVLRPNGFSAFEPKKYAGCILIKY